MLPSTGFRSLPMAARTAAAAVLDPRLAALGLGTAAPPTEDGEVRAGREPPRGPLTQALFLDTFSVVFRTLLHTLTMSQTIPDINGYSQIFPVSEGMSF